MGIRCTLIARGTRGEERRLHLDKAWDALEILSTGGRGVRGGLGDAVTGRGGTPCEPTGGFGPSHRLSRARVEAIAKGLAMIREETLRARFPLLAEMDVHGSFGRRDDGVDPEIAQMLREEGFDDDVGSDDERELLDRFASVAEFYWKAHEDGAEVIVSIT